MSTLRCSLMSYSYDYRSTTYGFTRFKLQNAYQVVTTAVCNDASVLYELVHLVQYSEYCLQPIQPTAYSLLQVQVHKYSLHLYL